MDAKTISDVDLESRVLGACIRYPETFDAIAKLIPSAEVFYKFAHQVLWDAMRDLARDNLPVDPPSIFQAIVKRKRQADCGADYIIDLFNNAPATAVNHHVRTLVELWVRRQTVHVLRDVDKLVRDPSNSPLVTVEEAKAKLERIAAATFERGDDEDAAGERWIPFPVENLPAELGDFIHAAAEALHCDPAFIAIPAIVTVAGAIGNSRIMVVKETWQEPCVFWASVVADSSSLKSPSMDIANQPLWALQRSFSAEYDVDYRRWKDAVAEWSRSRFSKGGGDDLGDADAKPEKPTLRRVLVNDVTIEKLSSIMHENPMGVTLFRDELAGWFGSFGRYADGKGPSADMANWLSIFRAGSVIVDRKGGDPPTLSIPRASCSVYGTIQPRILKRLLTEDFFDSGLASRLLLSMPPRKPKIWSEAVVPQDVYDTYSNAIKEIYFSGEEGMQSNGGGPRPVGFSKAGKSAWIEFYQEWSDRQTAADGEFGYALAKLEGYCARFCLLLSTFEKATNHFRREEVTEGMVKKSFGLVSWFANEIQRVYRMVRTPEDADRRKRLVEFIAIHGGEMTPSRLAKSNPSRYETADDAEKTLDGLVAAKLADWILKPSGTKGGRPSRTLRLKPPKT